MDNSQNMGIEEWCELNDWLQGKTDTVPEFLRVQSSDMLTKLAFSLNFITNASILRAIKLQEFIIKAEEELFTDENLLKMEPEAILTLYKEAIKNLKDVQQTINNYKRSNKDLLEKTDLQTDTLKDLLLSLPQDKIEQLMDLLQGED